MTVTQSAIASTFDSTVYCGDAHSASAAQVNLCDNRQVIGVSCGDYRRHGAFAEYVAVPQRILYHLPANLSFAEAAMLEAASVALHAVHVSEVHGGETALVIGAGMIGLADSAGGARRGMRAGICRGCRCVATGTGRQIGADEISACLRTRNWSRKVHRPDRRPRRRSCVEAVGRNETVNAAIDCTRKGGTVTLIGNIQPEVTLPLQKVVTRQIRLQGSCASAGEYPQAIELIASGKIKVASADQCRCSA